MDYVNELEKLVTRAQCLGNMGAALQNGLYNTDSSADDYSDAMWLYVDLIEELSKNLQQYFNAVLKEKRAQPHADAAPKQGGPHG